MNVHPLKSAIVVGAGLAGLSAAVSLAGRGVAVRVLEASAQAGGRCRSYVDPVLGMTLDNGNHLVLSGNHATFDYLRAIGAEDRLVGPDEARLDFHDLASHKRWTIRPNPSALPWWIWRPAPGARHRAARLSGPGPAARPQGERTIGEAIACEGPLWDRLLEPFLLAALNTEAKSGSAALAGAVIAQSLARGGNAYRPRIAHPTLSAAFIEPALAFLAAHGASVRMGAPVRGLTFDGDRVTRAAHRRRDPHPGRG